jgi:hypothetical protein
MIDQVIELFDETSAAALEAMAGTKPDGDGQGRVGFEQVVEAETPRPIYTGLGVNPLNVEAAMRSEKVVKAARAVAEAVTSKIGRVVEAVALSWAGANIRSAHYQAQTVKAVEELYKELHEAEVEGRNRVEVLRTTVRGLRRIWPSMKAGMDISVFSKEGV